MSRSDPYESLLTGEKNFRTMMLSAGSTKAP